MTTKQEWEFIGLFLLSMVLSKIPLISIPFQWYNTYFHEISHGILALITGGEIVYIEIHLLGSGLCAVKGGHLILIAFAGYIGAVFWGMLLYMMASRLKRKRAIQFVFALSVGILVSLLLYARDQMTIVIMCFILASMILIVLLRDKVGLRILLKFIGMFVLVDAIKSPTYLIDGTNRGDGGTLERLTSIPEYVWIGIWLVFALWGLRQIWVWESKK